MIKRSHKMTLNIFIRRDFILHDSYHQLRTNPIEDLKGRLTVEFVREEVNDDGG